MESKNPYEPLPDQSNKARIVSGDRLKRKTEPQNHFQQPPAHHRVVIQKSGSNSQKCLPNPSPDYFSQKAIKLEQRVGPAQNFRSISQNTYYNNQQNFLKRTNSTTLQNGHVFSRSPSIDSGSPSTVQRSDFVKARTITTSKITSRTPSKATNSTKTRHFSSSTKNNNPKDDARRKQHNEVERRRRDKINMWIGNLAKIVPECKLDTKSTQSKGGILAKTYKYIEMLDADNKELIRRVKSTPLIPEGASVDEAVEIRLRCLDEEASRLRKELQEAHADRDDIMEQLKKQGIMIKMKESDDRSDARSDDWSECKTGGVIQKVISQNAIGQNAIGQNATCQNTICQNHPHTIFSTKPETKTELETIEICNPDFDFNSEDNSGMTTAEEIIRHSDDTSNGQAYHGENGSPIFLVHSWNENENSYFE